MRLSAHGATELVREERVVVVEEEEGGCGVKANDIRYISTGKQRQHAY